MALPEIPGLYENVRTVSGLQVGGSVDQIIAANNGSIDWIKDCVSLVSNNKYNLNPISGRTIPNYNSVITSKKEDFCKGTFTDNTSWMLTLGIVNYTSMNNNGAFYGPYERYSTYYGSIYNAQGTAYTGLNNVYPIITGANREHYIGVVRVSAFNEQGQTWNGYLKDYRAQQSTYPYISQATIGYYYKPDIGNPALVGVQIGYISVPKLITSIEQAQYEAIGGDPNYNYRFKGNVFMGLGTSLVSRPPISSRVISDLLIRRGFRTVVTGVVSDGPYDALKYHAGTLGATAAEDKYPFVYYTINDVIQAANSRGLWWAESETEASQNAKGTATTSEYVHAPLVTDEGATTVLDHSGSSIYENWTQEGYRNEGGITIIYNYNINNNSVEDQTYNYDPLIDVNNPEPTGDNPDLELGASTYTGVGCFSTYYAMNIDNIVSLNDELWTSDEDWYHALLEGLRLWGAEPMQAIMSMRLYPFDVAVATGVTTAQNDVYFGRVLMQTKAAKIPPNATVVLDLGETWINAKNLGLHGDFRDYAPYTAVTLYIPFIGLTQININDFMNTVMKIRMTVDITTGSCSATVYCVKDGHSTPYLYLPGTIGVDIPVTLDTMTEVAVALLQGTMSLAMGAVAGGAVAIGTGIETQAEFGGFADQSMMPDMQGGINPDAYAKREAQNIGNTAANIMFGKTSMDRTGNASPASALTFPLYCYLIVSTPTWERPENYDHTYGKVCHTSGTLGSFHGYTICRNPDLTGINCTKMEQNMIQHYLESGVYL